ncbi:MAG: DNRLRE domain-containing protein [Gemmataceae bacterium]
MRWLVLGFLLPLTAVCALLARTAPPLLSSVSGSKTERNTLTFQQGVNGYKGTIDVEIWELAPHTCLDANPNVTVDADNDGGESQTLIRFEDIFGASAGQIPPGATIHSAKLVVSAFDPGTTVHLHRMLVPWKRTATWNSLISGITADGLEASRQKDSFTFGKISASSSEIVFEVTDTVQAWAKGEKNYGWVFLNTGPNGWDFYSSEYEQVAERPRLIVTYSISHR